MDRCLDTALSSGGKLVSEGSLGWKLAPLFILSTQHTESYGVEIKDGRTFLFRLRSSHFYSVPLGVILSPTRRLILSGVGGLKKPDAHTPRHVD